MALRVLHYCAKGRSFSYHLLCSLSQLIAHRVRSVTSWPVVGAHSCGFCREFPVMCLQYANYGEKWTIRTFVIDVQIEFNDKRVNFAVS